MSKPHEEHWEHSHSGRIHVGEAGPSVEAQFSSTDRAYLAVAAPAMARELLEVRRLLTLIASGDPSWHRGGKVERRLAEVESVLADAGVTLP